MTYNSIPSFSLLAWSRAMSCFFALLIFSQGLVAQEPSPLQRKLQVVANSFEGQSAIAVKHLKTGEACLIHADLPMPTASLIKVAVMIEAYRQADAGELDLNQKITLKEEDKVPGSGILTPNFSAGLSLSVHDAIRLMMAYSDNTATNLVVDQIGLTSTAKTMESLGFPNTKLHSKVYRGSTSFDKERSQKFGLGSTTAQEMLTLLEQLHYGKLASQQSTQEMLTHMERCENEDRLPRYLPSRTKIAHKTGTVRTARTVAGIIDTPTGPLIVVVLTAKINNQPWASLDESNHFMATVAKIAFDEFNPQTGSEREIPNELREGAEGWIVEALQRTLNARMTPSPQLSVDGDFGPATRGVVETFQKTHQLPVTGVVDKNVWQRLGPLVTSNVVITDPAEFNLQPLGKADRDSLDGIPFVTCKSWIVGSPVTGDIVGGAATDAELENASTTKLMTAWIVAREIQKEPGLLDKWVTISPRAAATPGSTANVQSGEQLTVRDLLYGLLLPSGNDASVAIAEFFGPRFELPADQPEATDPVVRFVAEMNRSAKQLGMTQTSFKNPHGLSSTGHHTTVNDLFRLASAVVQDGALLPYVQTRKHVGKLIGSSGYQRYELWSNTNQLLGIDGYLGMKTGTTRGAGACLVSLGTREGQQLITVVLGSTSSSARYTDTRNLYRWAWNQLVKTESPAATGRSE